MPVTKFSVTVIAAAGEDSAVARISAEIDRVVVDRQLPAVCRRGPDSLFDRRALFQHRVAIERSDVIEIDVDIT